MKTEEQIKQDANAYADSMKEVRGELEWVATRDDFIAGAHSRDEEIINLQGTVNELMLVADAAEVELHQLRNPWISVEDRLPQDRTKVLVQYIDGDCEVVWYRDKKFVCVVPDQQKYIGKAMVLTEGVMVEKPIFSVPQREVVTDIVTHWMPIPQPKGGEK